MKCPKCKEYFWSYQQNFYKEDTYMVHKVGEPMIYVLTEHSAKYITEKLNELDNRQT